MLTDPQISALASLAANLLRTEARKLGVDLSEDTIATVANVLRPLLGLARRFAVQTATINDQRKEP